MTSLGLWRCYLVQVKQLPPGSLIMTDSQAVDLVHSWTLDEDGQGTHAMSTFSIAMINYMSGGQLADYVQGLHAFLHLQDGDR